MVDFSAETLQGYGIGAREWEWEDSLKDKENKEIGNYF
jgi:hypothetical protein